MDFEPANSVFAKSLAFGEEKNATGDVMTHVVQVRRDWIDAPSEIAVVREVDLFAWPEALGDSKFE